jgi:hypothetical protein
MDMHTFKESLLMDQLPQEASVYIKALWYDAKDKWDDAHKTIQDVKDNNASWIHAYLHRKEGDISNADYWYTRAGRKRPPLTLEEEWEQLVANFLQ